jgi:hypothetical protein
MSANNKPDPNFDELRADLTDQNGSATGDAVSSPSVVPAGADELHAVVAAMSPDQVASIDVVLDQMIVSTDLFDIGPFDTDGAG